MDQIAPVFALWCGLMFNNLEQGFILVFLAVMAGSAFMAMLAIQSASLRTIGIEHHLKRIAEALERENITVEEDPRSVERRLREQAEGFARSVPPDVTTMAAAAGVIQPDPPPVPLPQPPPPAPGPASFSVTPDTCDHRRVMRIAKVMQNGDAVSCSLCGADLVKRADPARAEGFKLERAYDGH